MTATDGWADKLVGSLAPISLQTLDERAALLRRVDRKYVIDSATLGRLLEAIRGDHDVLEIDGDRVFAYESVYFDTDDLRCFREHAEGVKPRYKARTRRYVDAGSCVFEVKLKPVGGGTDKRQADHPSDAAAQLTPGAAQLLEATLHEAGIAPPTTSAPVLRTSFHRLTLAARAGDARLTVDVGVTLARMDGAAVRLPPDRVLAETKSEHGESRADTTLAELGAEALSLSKYRTGIDALLQRDDTGEVDPVRGLFLRTPGDSRPEPVDR